MGFVCCQPWQRWPGLITVPTLQLALITEAERETCSAAAPSVPAPLNLNVISVTLSGEEHKQTWNPLPLPTEKKKTKPKTKNWFTKAVPTVNLGHHSVWSTFVACHLGFSCYRGFLDAKSSRRSRQVITHLAGKWSFPTEEVETNPSWYLHQHHLEEKLKKKLAEGCQLSSIFVYSNPTSSLWSQPWQRLWVVGWGRRLCLLSVVPEQAR